MPPPMPPFFLASHLALDFLNSYATPDGHPMEWIGDGTGFRTWYEAAGLASSVDVKTLLASLPAKRLDGLAAKARELREVIRSALRESKSARDHRALYALLNRCMESGSAFRRIELVEDQRQLIEQERFEDPAQLLVPLAAAAARLLVDEDLSRVRVCEGPGCSLWFLDRTKSGTRRFCSAATCGNRAKVAAFRARERLSKED